MACTNARDAVPTDDGAQSVQTSVEVSEQPDTLWGRTWVRLKAGWEVVDETLADFFGLNDSKYQWAVDEYFREHEEKQKRKEVRRKLRAERKAKHMAEEEIRIQSMETGGDNAEGDAGGVANTQSSDHELFDGADQRAVASPSA